MLSTTEPSDKASRGNPGGSSEQFIKRYATVATIATFLIVGITGVLLFYHIGDRYLRSAHEWLGMAFVIASIFHLARHSRAFTSLMKEPRTQVAILLATAITVLFVVTAPLGPGTHGGDKGKWHGEASPPSGLVIERAG